MENGSGKSDLGKSALVGPGGDLLWRRGGFSAARRRLNVAWLEYKVAAGPTSLVGTIVKSSRGLCYPSLIQVIRFCRSVCTVSVVNWAVGLLVEAALLRDLLSDALRF